LKGFLLFGAWCQRGSVLTSMHVGDVVYHLVYLVYLVSLSIVGLWTCKNLCVMVCDGWWSGELELFKFVRPICASVM
jgi:hypothetical protein